jgi:rubrerythrin
MSNTEKNLGDAFAGESQANRKYLAFAKQAEQEGYKPVAKLFRAAAEAETVHAHAHLRTLGGIGKTMDNLKTAIAGETHEFKKMYPEFIQLCQRGGENPCGPLPEGAGQSGQECRRGLLRVFRVRHDR